MLCDIKRVFIQGRSVRSILFKLQRQALLLVFICRPAALRNSGHKDEMPVTYLVKDRSRLSDSSTGVDPICMIESSSGSVGVVSQ